MLRRCHLASLLALLVTIPGCREPNGPVATPDAAPADAAVEPTEARDDLVPAIGTPEALDVATWNIENFPQNSSTPLVAAGIILSLDLDLVGVQEIADVDAFAELMAYLPTYDAILSTDTYSDGSYQKVGFIYRTGLLEPGSIDLLFTGDSYEFPRPPLEVNFTLNDPDDGDAIADFTAIVLHLKAGTGANDRARRRDAMQELGAYIENLTGAGEDRVLLLGDFNEDFATTDALGVWAPVLDNPDLYDLHTAELDENSFSFIPWPRLIDHVVTTDGLTGGVNSRTEIPTLEQEINGYTSSISDHRPVVTSITGMW